MARSEPHGAEHRRSIADGAALVDGPLFRLDRVEGAPDATTRAAYGGALLALPLAGEVVAADGSTRGWVNPLSLKVSAASISAGLK